MILHPSILSVAHLFKIAPPSRAEFWLNVDDETESSVDSEYQTDAEESSESDNTDESEDDVEDTTDTEKSNDTSESTTENIYDDRWTGNY